MFYIYILKCSDGSFYTGHTESLDKRISQHQQAYFSNCYTANRLPCELVYQASFDSRKQSLFIERQIRGWSRQKKRALINDDWIEIARLSRVKIS